MIVSSLFKDTDAKELRAKARRFLTVLSEPTLKNRVIEMLQMNFAH
jgi:hypothetical protein